MPRTAKELTALAVSRIKAPGIYAVGGVPGLLLQVTSIGARSWLLRVTAGTRRREVGLGSATSVSLSAARDKARGIRAMVEEGLDPVAERRRAKDAHAAVLTFDEAARRLIAAKGPEWRNAKHKQQWVATLATYASPRIGRKPIDEVDVRDMEAVLSPIWSTKTETAMRLRGRMEAVLAWATVSGYRSGDNPARWRHNLDKLLAKPSRVRKVAHHPALLMDEVAGFMDALWAKEGIAARALSFLVLTAARSQEVRLANWDEVDLDTAVWSIPAAHMKAGRSHSVPLSAAAVRLLVELPRISGSNLVFPSPRGGSLSDMTLSKVVRDLHAGSVRDGGTGYLDPKQGRVVVPHGFRSTFRDWAAERTNYPREAAEMALAHAIESKVEAAYRRGDMFEKRVRMMEDWSRFVRATAGRENVTDIAAVARR